MAILVSACARSASPQSESQAVAGRTVADTRAEITRLAAEIDEWRGQAGLEVRSASADVGNEDEPVAAARGSASDAETVTAAAAGTRPASPRDPIPGPGTQCPDHNPSAACADHCTLASNICDNANRICQLADDLPGDQWAASKCQSARSSCQQAVAHCCECRRGN